MSDPDNANCCDCWFYRPHMEPFCAMCRTLQNCHAQEGDDTLGFLMHLTHDYLCNGKPITPEAREVVEAVIGGAKIAYELVEEDWDMWCVSIPREPDFTPVTKPCPECGGGKDRIPGLPFKRCPTCRGTGVAP